MEKRAQAYEESAETTKQADVCGRLQVGRLRKEHGATQRTPRGIEGRDGKEPEKVKTEPRVQAEECLTLRERRQTPRKGGMGLSFKMRLKNPWCFLCLGL